MSILIDVDLQLKLLRGTPIFVENVPFMVVPLTVGEIIDLGYLEYWSTLLLLCQTKESILEQAENPDEKLLNSDIYDLFAETVYNYPAFKQDFKRAFKLFTNEEINVIEHDGSYKFILAPFEELRIVNKEDFLLFQDILRVQNVIPIEETVDLSAMSPERRRAEEAKRVRDEILRKQEQEDGEEQSFSAILSTLAATGVMNFEEMFNSPLYRIYDQFERHNMYQDFQVSTQAILAGGDAKKIKRKPYTRQSNLLKGGK